MRDKHMSGTLLAKQVQALQLRLKSIPLLTSELLQVA